MKLLNNRFDLIISLGEDCACSSYLRRVNLQNFSYPFDWLTHAPFENRTNLIVNDFKDFLNLEDLELMQKPTEFPSDENHDYYKNKTTELYHWHDFPINMPLKEAYNLVKTKYDRRIERLYSEIKNSQKILFVWLSHRTLHSPEDFIKEYNTLQNKFASKDIYLLIIENSPEYKVIRLEDNHILIINQDTISNDKKHHYDQTMGNKTNNLRIFKKIKLKISLIAKIKRIIYIICKNIVSLIPNKKIRNQLKQNLNMYFYHAKL